jgi:hypothetical protein
MQYFLAKEKRALTAFGFSILIGMQHIKAHLTPRQQKKERATERGEMMEYFRDKLNRERIRDGLSPLSMPRMAKILQLIPTKDLYYLKSVCDQATNFSKKFWWEVNPKKHEDKKTKK